MTHDDVADDLPLPDEKGPERTCIVTRRTGDKGDLIRFVLGPERTLVPDIRAKLPGRGAWVSADGETVGLALKRKSFSRAFKGEVVMPADLVAMIDGLLTSDALQTLALCNKVGLVTCGTTKVEAAIMAKPLVGLVHATEAGEDGIRKLMAAIRRRYGNAGDAISRVQIFASHQLDLALGRTHVIHASLAAGAVSDGFIARSRRLERYRGLGPPSAVPEPDEGGRSAH